MRYIQKVAVAICLVLCMVSATFCLDSLDSSIMKKPMAPLAKGFRSFDEEAISPCFIDFVLDAYASDMQIDLGLLRLGSGYRNFEEMFKSVALINPILYEDGNNFDLVFEVFEPQSGEELMRISSPAPFYVFTNAERGGEKFPYLSSLLFRYAETFGIKRNDPYCWGLFASDIWCGAVPQNFKLDGNDTISFGGYDRPVMVSGKLKPEESVSIRARQKAREEALGKTAKDYIVQCAAYVNYKPLLIRVRTEAGKLVFWYDVYSDYQYRLIDCMFRLPKMLRLREISPMRMLDAYKGRGVEDFYICKVDNMNLFYYWKDIKNNYLLELTGDGTIEVCPIVDEETIYPLFFETIMITQEMLESHFNEEKPTITETRFVEHNGYVTQEFVKRPVTFEEFLKSMMGDTFWAMGFRKFGNSIQLKK